ncbi:MAG: lysylphosphatidylglycerol synthase domain-containing protein [Acidimicrobiia bacterium]
MAENRGERPKRIQWWRTALPAALVILLFGWLLPQVVDYGDVWDAMLALAPWQILVLAALGIVWSLVEAGVMTTLIPGLGVVAGWRAFLGSMTVGSVIPAPWDVLTRFGMYRAFGVESEAAGAGVLVGGLMTLAVKIITPLLVLVYWVAVGTPGERVVLVTVLVVGAAVAGAAAIAGMLAFEGFARWLGRAIQATADRLLPVFGREPRRDLEDVTVGFRDQLVRTLANHWPGSLGFAVGAHVVRFVGLVVAFRSIGVGTDVVPTTLLAAVYAVSLLASMTPMVPAGLGAVEMVFIWALGSADQVVVDVDAVAAAVFIHRIFFWVLPVAVGVVPLVRWARGGLDLVEHPA